MAAIFFVVAALVAAGGFIAASEGPQLPGSASLPASPSAAHRAVVNAYCLSCHNDRLKTGGLALDAIIAREPGEHPDVWEKVVRKLRARQMPPVGMRRPDEATYQAALASLEDLARPRGGRHAQSRPHRDVPAAEPHRIPERDSRSAGARRRRRRAAAGGRGQLRLRQRHRRRSLADAAGALHLGGAEDQPAGASAAPADRRAATTIRIPAGPHAGRTRRRPAARHPRRRASSRTRSRSTASTRSRSG